MPWNWLLKTPPANLLRGWNHATMDQVTVQLGDFRSALKRNQGGRYVTNPSGGSTDYLAPEVKSSLNETRSPYSHRADVHSAALCLVELFAKGIIGIC